MQDSYDYFFSVRSYHKYASGEKLEIVNLHFGVVESRIDACVSLWLPQNVHN